MGASRVTAGVALVGIAVGTDFTGDPTDGAVAPETVAGAETPVANLAAGWVVADSQELDPRPNAAARHAIAVTFIVFRIPRPRLCRISPACPSWRLSVQRAKNQNSNAAR